MSSINSVSYPVSAVPTAPTKPNQQAKTDFKALSDALKAGDVTAAQTAFAALKKDDPNIAKKLSDQDSTTSQNSPLNNLAAALDKGDLNAAQTAMASLKKGGGHHGHHRASANKTDTSASTTSAASDTSTTGTTGTVIDVKV